jgi:ferredoxin
VVLERSGISIHVGGDESIFSAAERAGVSVLGSCREGICGTCETVVIEGEVDHRDSVLSAAEQEANDSMMICVSRARGPRLVIDL